MESQSDVFPGIAAYQDGKTPAVRWAQMGPLDSEIRLRTLVIDPGPRAISARANAGQTVAFDKATVASRLTESGTVTVIAHYPKSFPDASPPETKGEYIVVKCGGLAGIKRNPIMQVWDQAELPHEGVVDLVPRRHDVAYLRGKAGIGGHGPCPGHRLASPILKQDHRIDRTARR